MQETRNTCKTSEWWINYDIDPYHTTHKISNARNKKYMQDERVMNKLRYRSISANTQNIQCKKQETRNKKYIQDERVMNKLRYRSVSQHTKYRMQETRNTCKTSEWWINYDITTHKISHARERENSQQVTVTCSSRTKISIAASVYASEWWINYDIDPYRPTHKISNARNKKYMQDERVMNKLRYRSISANT